MIEVFHAIEVLEEGALRRDRLPVLVRVDATTIDAVESAVEPLTPPRSEPTLEPLRLHGSGVSDGHQTFPAELYRRVWARHPAAQTRGQGIEEVLFTTGCHDVDTLRAWPSSQPAWR